jgi:hypothetical protein
MSWSSSGSLIYVSMLSESCLSWPKNGSRSGIGWSAQSPLWVFQLEEVAVDVTVCRSFGLPNLGSSLATFGRNLTCTL